VDRGQSARTTRDAADAFASLTSAQLAAMLRRKDFYFVNVHTPYEGEIRNTDAFIAFDRTAQNPRTRRRRSFSIAGAAR